ncbi:MAG: succinylglutamate desuccinylase [Kiloniellales bacterium]
MPQSAEDDRPVEPAPERARPGLTLPDISAHAAGNCGLDYVHCFEARAPGPHVALVALVHGNEICGAVALDRLLRARVRPRRGRLSVVFANAAAFESLAPHAPNAARFLDQDLNRLWDRETLDGAESAPERAPERARGPSHELNRARALRPLIDSVDVLLDLHSMQAPSPPLTLAGPHEKGRRLAARVGVPALVVSDAGHAAGRRLRDYGAFGDPASPRNALLVECGRHYEAASAAVAWEVTLRFLAGLEVVEPAFVAEFPKPLPQRFIEVTEAVTVESDAFRFVRPFAGLEVLARGEPIAEDGGRTILAPYDGCVLVMPSWRFRKGQTAVRLGRTLTPERALAAD